MNKAPTITTANAHGFSVGDTVTVPIDNSFWKVFWHWFLQLNLKRQKSCEIKSVTENTFTYEIDDDRA